MTATNALYSTDIALRVHQLLALAASERELLAVFSLNLVQSTTLYLLYLHESANEGESIASVVARYPDDRLNCRYDDPDIWEGIQDFARHALARPDPVWFADDVQQDMVVVPSFLSGTRSLLVLRLAGRRHVKQNIPRPHALLCIAFPTHHPFEAQERSFYVAVLDAAAAVVSNHRLRLEALDNVRQLTELDRLKTQFIASMSHEFRTPLNGIIALSSGIVGGGTGETNAETLSDAELIYRSGEQLRLMVADVLDYARVEAGQPLAVDLEPVSVSAIVGEVVMLIQRLNSERPIRIDSSVTNDLPGVIADSQRVQQILTNLLVNAVKFTERGFVEVSGQCSDREVILCVRDSGIGIAPENQSVIFEPFRQVNANARFGGAGLGLSICKHLVALMNGRIWVESQPGQGSRFYFSLPMA